MAGPVVAPGAPPIRIGVVGLGSIAQRVYLPLLTRDERLAVVGLVSRRAEVLAAQARLYRVPAAGTDLDALLALAPEVVFIHASTAAHPELVRRCLQAGVHVYVDKPLAYDLETAEELTALAGRHDRLLAVGFNRRFAPTYLAAREWFAEVGGAALMVAGKHRGAVHDQDARTAVFDDLIHLLDLLAWFTDGDPQLTDAQLRVDHQDRFLLAVGGTRPAGRAGLLGRFAMCRTAGADLEEIALHGHGRSAQLTGLERGRLQDHTGTRTVRSDPWEPIATRRGFTGLLDEVLAGLQDPAGCSVAATRVLVAHRLAEQVLRSQPTPK
ncbi:MAG: Gfo/Idh/MocA family protein [Marmoricola sp.]